jgi:D-galactarolactone cycloisomerase
MRIVNIDLRLLEYPLETPFYPSWLPGYPQTAHRVNLLTLETDEGIKGYAAGVAFLREGAGLKDLLLPFLFGATR